MCSGCEDFSSSRSKLNLLKSTSIAHSLLPTSCRDSDSESNANKSTSSASSSLTGLSAINTSLSSCCSVRGLSSVRARFEGLSSLWLLKSIPWRAWITLNYVPLRCPRTQTLVHLDSAVLWSLPSSSLLCPRYCALSVQLFFSSCRLFLCSVLLWNWHCFHLSKGPSLLALPCSMNSLLSAWEVVEACCACS